MLNQTEVLTSVGACDGRCLDLSSCDKFKGLSLENRQSLVFKHRFVFSIVSRAGTLQEGAINQRPVLLQVRIKASYFVA